MPPAARARSPASRAGRPQLRPARAAARGPRTRGEASWNRRVSDAAYSDGIGGRPSHCTLSSAIRSTASGPPAARSPRTIATRSACSRASAAARARSAARSCRRDVDRFAHGFAGRVEPLHQRGSISASACSSAHARRTSASASIGLVGIGQSPPAPRLGAAAPRRAGDRRRSSAPALSRGCAASSSWRSFVARAARRHFVARRAGRSPTAPPGRCTRSSAATATSVCSDFSATLQNLVGVRETRQRAQARAPSCA